MEKARLLRGMSLTYNEIGLIMGVSRERVRQILRQEGGCVAGPYEKVPRRPRLFRQACKACGELMVFPYPRVYHPACLPRQEVVELACFECGKKFPRAASAVKLRRKKGLRRSFCSLLCGRKTSSRERTERPVRRPQAPQLLLRCARCSKEFLRAAYRVRSSRQYCSSYCGSRCNVGRERTPGSGRRRKVA